MPACVSGCHMFVKWRSCLRQHLQTVVFCRRIHANFTVHWTKKMFYGNIRGDWEYWIAWIIISWLLFKLANNRESQGQAGGCHDLLGGNYVFQGHFPTMFSRINKNRKISRPWGEVPQGFRIVIVLECICIRSRGRLALVYWFFFLNDAHGMNRYSM